MAHSAAVRPGGLWQRDFSLLFLSRFVKVAADNVSAIAMVWLLIEMGGGAADASVLYTCSLVPQVVGGSLVGPLLSRGRLQHWMFASDAVRAALVALVPVCHQHAALPFWLFFALAFLQSACGAVYTPASVGLLPRVVESSRLQQANALLQSSQEVVTLLGLAGAGALVTLLAPGPTLLVTAGLFLVSAMLILLVRTPYGLAEADREGEGSTAAGGSGGTSSYWRQICEGFRLVKSHKILYALNVYALFLNLGIAPWAALGAVYVAQDLHGDAAVLAALRGSTALGAMAMGLFLARRRVRRLGALFVAAGVAEGVCFVLMGLLPDIRIGLIACLILGISLSAINVPEMVIVQTALPQHQQAQAFAVIMAISYAFLPVGYLLAGALAETLGAGTVVAAGGLMMIAAGAAVWLATPLPRMKLDEAGQAAKEFPG